MSAPDETPTPRDARRSGFLTFWTTLPGVLTGVAALVTAIVSVVTLVSGMGGDGEAESRSAGAKPATTLQETAASATSASAPPATSVAGDVLVQGELTMKSPDDADLEKGVVGPGVPEGDVYLYCSGLDCILNATGSGLMTRTDGPADKRGSAAALNSRREQALEVADLEVGSTLCLQTREGHLTAPRGTGLPSAGSPEFTFDYSLWR